jgi:glycosyltransferase involved in cell wall biosynthesis
VRIALALLTYNEIDGVRALFDRIPFDHADEAFAVDGGSTDGTRELFRDRGLRVLDQTSGGRGEAFRLAFASTDADAIVFFSPDGNENPDDIPRFREHIEGGAAMVIASRMMEGAANEEDAQRLRLRKWANNAFNWLANLFWNRSAYVTDSINGFRAIRRSAWDRIGLDGTGYTIEYQSTIRCMKLGLPITEFPTIESERIGGESYAKSLPTGLRFLRLLLREILVGRRFATPS